MPGFSPKPDPARPYSAKPYSAKPDLAWLKREAARFGFGRVGVADIDLADAEPGLQAWLDAGHHGDMDYMARHGLKRARPAELVPGTVSAIMVAIDYAPQDPDWVAQAWATLAAPERAFVSRYALGRDYHKVVRGRLARLADALQAAWGPFGHRVFCDSAPVLEVELAVRAGLGWRGKHTLLLATDAGSTAFIGTLYTDLVLAPTGPGGAAAAGAGHCGSCERCLEVCPTRAITAPYRLDARRCISYLTIEHEGVIAPEWRRAIGNRIVGCDDCQLACPWNKFARRAPIADFAPRERLDVATLVDLFGWSEATFDARLQGSAIRRIGWRRWQRNLAIAMGNALRDGASGAGRAAIVAALRGWLAGVRPDPIVAVHVAWALDGEAG